MSLLFKQIFNIFMERWTSFQFTQQNYVQEINQSGMKGRLPSTAQRKMDICVYRTDTLLSC